LALVAHFEAVADEGGDELAVAIGDGAEHPHDVARSAEHRLLRCRDNAKDARGGREAGPDPGHRDYSLVIPGSGVPDLPRSRRFRRMRAQAAGRLTAEPTRADSCPTTSMEVSDCAESSSLAAALSS